MKQRCMPDLMQLRAVVYHLDEVFSIVDGLTYTFPRNAHPFTPSNNNVTIQYNSHKPSRSSLMLSVIFFTMSGTYVIIFKFFCLVIKLNGFINKRILRQSWVQGRLVMMFAIMVSYVYFLALKTNKTYQEVNKI